MEKVPIEMNNNEIYGTLIKPTVARPKGRAKSPVDCWLSSLRDATEVESLSALQAKSVAVSEEAFEALSIRNAQVGS